MEFLLYLDFTLTAFYFLSQISKNSLNKNAILMCAKVLVISIFILLIAVLIYFIVLLCYHQNKYRKCNDPIWIMTRTSAFVLGLVYLGIGLKATYGLKALKNNPNFLYEKQGEHDLWYFILRVLIIIMFVSVSINFIVFFTPLFYDFKDCNLLENSENAGKMTVFAIVRILTHFLPIWLSLFVFWHSRQIDRPNYLKFSSGTFSLASLEYLDRDDVAFKSTLNGNVN